MNRLIEHRNKQQHADTKRPDDLCLHQEALQSQTARL
ncbi:conserved hypothetical protein [Xylella fastidiosa M12]|nr:conserved hypothetical protein [Xylella fastidiosa M12]